MKPANAIETLPDDVAQCHALIQEQAKTIAEQQRLAARLQHQVEQLLKRLYGPRAERIDPAQLVLFAQELTTAQEPEVAPEEQAPAPTVNKGHGRKPLPKDLPRQRIVHDVPAHEKICPECGADKKRIGEEVSEQVEYVPASLFILEHVRPKYACPCCQEHVVVADKPAKVIEKGLPGPGLVAHVITSKYCDHLPLYRQEFMLARHGVELSRKTLCGWVMTAAGKVQPLIELMKKEVLASNVIHTDDTPVRVQGDKDNGAFTGRFWVYVGDETHPYTVYDYTPSRKRDGPAAFLDGYKGYLQARPRRTGRRLRRIRRHLCERRGARPRRTSSKSRAGRTPGASSTMRARPTRTARTGCSRGSANSTTSSAKARCSTQQHGAPCATTNPNRCSMR
jgi:transposase